MRVQLTVERLTGATRGPSVVQRPSGKHSSYVGDGLFFHSSVVIYMLTIDSFSILPALSLHDGILHCKILEGSFCTLTFQNFIRELLDMMQPYPGPNSVIVMDNCRIHKHPDIINMINER